MAVSDRKSPLGIIAGAGPLPQIVSREGSKQGREVVAVGLTGFSDPKIESVCDKFAAFEIGELSAMIEFLKASGAEEVLLCGHVDHSSVFSAKKFDELMSAALAEVDKRAEKLLGRIADAIESKGLRVGDLRAYLSSHLAGEGILGNAEPSAELLGELGFAWPLAVKVSELNIGQAVIVNKGVVLAVEALEGTDEMIRRAGSFPGKASLGSTVIKLPLKSKDPRFDIPVVGCQTVSAMSEVGAGQLAIAASQTIIIDEPAQFVKSADKAGIAVIARPYTTG